MAFQWLAVEAATGYPLDYLPDFRIDDATDIIGQTQTATGTYPIASTNTPVAWKYGTVPWAVSIVLLDDMAQDPVHGWYISTRESSEADTLRLQLVTAEGYLDRRYVGDVTFTGVDQNTIATSLVTSYAVASPAGSSGLAGIPFITNVIGAAGVTRDRTYTDISDTTVLNALTELMGVQGGPEFTCTWRHLTNPERYLPVFNVGTRIGSGVTPGLAPSTVFSMGGTSTGGSLTEVTYTEDFSSRKGANFVTATGTTGADNTRPKQSVSSPDARRPAVEYRWNPSTSITDTATLLAHAQSTLPIMAQGSRALALKSDATTGPRLGYDWFLGDTVGYQIGGLDQNGAETVPAFPGGLNGQARVIGWTIEPDAATPTVTPILGGV